MKRLACVLLAALRWLDVCGWLRGPEGADVHLHPGRSGLLSQSARAVALARSVAAR